MCVAANSLEQEALDTLTSLAVPLFPEEVNLMRTEEVAFDNGDKTVHTFNDAGLCVRTTDYDAAGEIRYDVKYEVDSSQRVVGWKVFDDKGNIVKRFEVDFDSQGREIEKRQFGADGTTL